MITTQLGLLSSFLTICFTVVGDYVLHRAFRRRDSVRGDFVRGDYVRGDFVRLPIDVLPVGLITCNGGPVCIQRFTVVNAGRLTRTGTIRW